MREACGRGRQIAPHRAGSVCKKARFTRHAFFRLLVMCLCPADLLDQIIFSETEREVMDFGAKTVVKPFDLVRLCFK